MKSLNYRNKIVDRKSVEQQIQQWKSQGFRIVFTNGCFDLLHPGHVDYLFKAAALGDKLVIGLNSDDSVQRLKGEHRPIQNEQSRGEILSALECTDLVVVFDEDTPLNLIQLVQPDVLVKGGDYQAETVVGYEEVIKSGGQVKILDFLPGHSTSLIESKIRGEML